MFSFLRTERILSSSTLFIISLIAELQVELSSNFNANPESRVRDLIDPLSPSDRLFTPWREKGAEMLKVDLEAAGIPYRDESGDIIDFHALRHTFATILANECNAHPKTMQELLRVSSIDLVMKYYTHSGFDKQAEAVSRLPSMQSPGE